MRKRKNSLMVSYVSPPLPKRDKGDVPGAIGGYPAESHPSHLCHTPAFSLPHYALLAGLPQPATANGATLIFTIRLFS